MEVSTLGFTQAVPLDVAIKSGSSPVPDDYASPVIMERVRREVEGDTSGDLYDMVEIRHAQTGQMLATCMMSDDNGLERIADLLSARRLWREAGRFRAMVVRTRKVRGA